MLIKIAVVGSQTLLKLLFWKIGRNDIEIIQNRCCILLIMLIANDLIKILVDKNIYYYWLKIYFQ